MTYRARRACAAIALAGALAGCASSTTITGSSQPMTDAARTQLQADVLAVSRAVAAHNAEGARAALADLQHDLAALEGTHAVSADRAARIEAVVSQLVARLKATPTPTPTVTRSTHVVVGTPKPAPAKPKPTPPPPGGHKHHHDGGGGGNAGGGRGGG